MAEQKFLTAPLKMDTMPPGIPFIIATEAAERFSFYGMRAILVVFMTQYLRDASGALAVMSGNERTERSRSGRMKRRSITIATAKRSPVSIRMSRARFAGKTFTSIRVTMHPNATGMTTNGVTVKTVMA